MRPFAIEEFARIVGSMESRREATAFQSAERRAFQSGGMATALGQVGGG